MTIRRVIVDDVLLVVADLDASRRLYTAALAPLGYAELHVQEDGIAYGAGGMDDFAIFRKSRHNGGPGPSPMLRAGPACLKTAGRSW